MELIRDIYNLRPRHKECVLTIGNFDGVHLGHQAVLDQLSDVAGRRGLPAVLMIFEPQPQEFFASEQKPAPARLSRLREKLQRLSKTPLDRVVCLRFNRALAAMTAQAFIDRLLVEKLGVACVVVGDDFRFGYQRRGDIVMLRQAGERYGFDILRSETYDVAGARVSSTRIRSALAADDLALAGALLGRAYSISGRIAYGDQLGRTIGFPTANIPLKRRVSALSGVYAVRIKGLAGSPLSGVANVGKRPTIGGMQERLEVHLFDFAADVYGRVVEVEFLHKIRPERRFASLDALKQQIRQDASEARDYFAQPVTAGDSGVSAC